MNVVTFGSRTLAATGVALLLTIPVRAQEQPVQSFPLNVYKRVLDGQWQGIRYASDGNVYFGSSTHSAHHGAAFFKFDPRTNQITMLAEDLTTICGEDPETNPQGKLHSDIVEANGWLYMSTHFSSELPGAYANWTGSHVIGYQLATGAFYDFGVVHPNYTSYSAIGVDPARNYLYVFVTGEDAGDVSYLYRIDTVSGLKTNLGQVGGGWAASFWMFVDRRGDVWFSVGFQNGALYRVTGATGRIDVFPNALPPMYRWDSEQLVSSTEQARRGIMWMQPLDGDRALFTLGWNGGMLYLFDSTKPIGSGQEFQPVKHIGYSDLGLAIGENRLFYYQRANRGFGQQEAQDFHLLSVSLDPATGFAISDHGLLTDQDGRVAWRLPGMMTDGHNRVFMIGDWWTLPGDLGTLRYRYNNGAETYEQLPRGEFFAVADVVIDDEPPGTPPPPPAPQSLVATTTSTTQIVLQWTDISAAETGFIIERCATLGCTAFVPVAQLGPNVTTFADAGLASSTLYRFRVLASNAGGNSVASNVAEAITLPTVPTAVAAVIVSSTQINITWSAAPGATGTKVERCSGAGCTNFIQVAQLTATTFSNISLAAGTLYRFRVRAYNAGGHSAYSDILDATTVSSAPAGLTATTISVSELSLRWTDTVGETGFRIDRCAGLACTAFVPVAQLGPNVTTFADAGLTSSTLYRFRVLASNAGGNSAASNVAEATTLPSVPTAVAAVIVSSSQINITWSAAPGATGAKVERCSGAGCTNFVQVAQLTTTTFNNTSLAGGTLYRFRVRAYNAGGHSAYSPILDAVTTPPAPGGLTATTVSSSELLLRWTDTVGESGFRIERCAGAACTGFAEIGQTAANQITMSNTGLATGTLYRYRVRAFNASGNSSPSNVAEATTQPATPQGLTATAVSNVQINLTWTAVTGAAGMRIERCAGAGCTAFVQIAQLAGVTAYASTGLAPGSVYRYRLRAYNNGGQSAYSNVAEAMLPPPVPGSLTVTPVSATELTLRWLDINGETGFRIERCLGAACSTFTEIRQVAANVVTVTDSGLQNASVYRYRVRSFNAGGSSPPSNIAQGTTPPAAPANLSATAVSATQVNLVWGPVAGATGTRIERCSGIVCTNFVAFVQIGPSVTSFVNTSLTPKVTYRYRVRAFNAGGQSAPSNIAQATTP